MPTQMNCEREPAYHPMSISKTPLSLNIKLTFAADLLDIR